MASPTTGRQGRRCTPGHTPGRPRRFAPALKALLEIGALRPPYGWTSARFREGVGSQMTDERVFDRVRTCRSATLRCRGPRSSGACPTIPWAGVRGSNRCPATAGTARPGRASGSLRAPAAWSRPTRRRRRVPYAELHCHSNFSFLDGASHPEELAEEAARLGLEALALTDHDGMYGVVRFAEAARAVGHADGVRGRADPGPDRVRTGTAGGRPGRAPTCWSWPGTPAATPGCAGPSAEAQLAGARRAPS